MITHFVRPSVYATGAQNLANSNGELANLLLNVAVVVWVRVWTDLIWQSDRRVQTFEGAHTVQNLTTGAADQRVAAA